MLHLTQLPRIQHSDNSNEQCVTSGFRREVDENCTLLGTFAASSGNSLPMFSENLSVPSTVRNWILDP